MTRSAALGDLDRSTNYVALFLQRQSRGFAGCIADNHSLDAGRDLPLTKLLERLQITRPALSNGVGRSGT
jgi:hypothetical protein